MEDIFIRDALGSCVHDESPSFEVQDGSCVDELPLTMEDDNFMEKVDSDPYPEELLLAAQMKHKIFSQDVVIKAFYEAEKAHRGQMRASGHPYLQHCVEIAVLLVSIGANSTVVAAGLLHDTLYQALLSYDHISRIFGAGVADLVNGVSKLSQLSKLARENKTAGKTVEADRLHTMFLAMADARAVVIKLADRLHNMVTLHALSPTAKQKRFAKETLEIFVPLANRLGISSWKVQLESLCFKHLNPDQLGEPSSKLVDSSTGAAKITYPVLLTGRHESLYNIYSNMLKKNLTMIDLPSALGSCVHYESPSSSTNAAMITSDIEKLEKALKDNLRLHGIYSKMLEEKLAMDN